MTSPAPVSAVAGLAAIREALKLASGTLARDLDQLPGQVVARLGAHPEPGVQRLVDQARRWRRRSWLCPLASSLAAPGGPLEIALTGHPDSVTAVAVTPDGCYAVSGSVPRTVMVWDLSRPALERTLTGSGRFGAGEGYGHDVDAIAVTADMDRVAATNRDGRIHVWNPRTGDRLYAAAGSEDETWRTALTPDGRWAASAFLSSIIGMMADRLARTVEVRHLTAAEAAEPRTVRVDVGAPNALALGDHAEALVVSNGGLHRFDPDGTHLDSIDGPSAAPGALAITPDGRCAVTGHHDGTLTVWSLHDRRVVTTLAGHSGPVRAVAITPTGHHAVSGSDDATVRIWDLDQRAQIAELRGHAGPVHSVAATPDASRIVSGGEDRTVRVWDTRAAARPSPHRPPVDSVEFSPDGTEVLATMTDGSTEVWNLDPGRSSPRPEVANALDPALTDRIGVLEHDLAGGANLHQILVVAATPDGRRAVCASRRVNVLSAQHMWCVDTITVRVWDLGTEPVSRVLAERSQNTVGYPRDPPDTDLAVAPDGHRAAGIVDADTVVVWDLDRAERIGSFITDTALTTCAISRDGTRLAAGGSTGDVHILEVLEI